MKLFDKIELHIDNITKGVLTLLLLWGLSMVVFKIRPFWHDEWRLIYNLKFKSHQQLWGTLDYTQQFPRVYLQLTKLFTDLLNYNYFSLRFPAFIIGVANVFLSWKLMKRIYSNLIIEGYLLVLMTVSNFTFIEYFVQTKHYQMEIFMSLVAFWQVLEMIELYEAGLQKKMRYILLCISFFIAPFFSYTYPIAIAPLFFMAFMQLSLWNDLRHSSSKRWQHVLPLVFLSAGIVIFYKVDVAQLLNDREMHIFWKFRMASEDGKSFHIIKNLWGWIANMGSGLLFEIIFGSLGIIALGYSFYKQCPHLYNRPPEKSAQILIYCLCLVVVVLVLFFAGKLPLSESKFNAFTIPALSVIVIFFLKDLRTCLRKEKLSRTIFCILFLALTGNIVTSVINTFTLPEYNKRISILHATDKAIEKAQSQNLPILITADIAYSDDISIYMPGMEMITADVILKTFPAYNVNKKLPVYAIKDVNKVDIEIKQLPDTIHKFLAGNGLIYKICERRF